MCILKKIEVFNYCNNFLKINKNKIVLPFKMEPVCPLCEKNHKSTKCPILSHWLESKMSKEYPEMTDARKITN